MKKLLLLFLHILVPWKHFCLCGNPSASLKGLEKFHLSDTLGKVCSFEQLEHVREMQEKLARLHFSLDSHVEELSEDQRKCASDHNLEHLLCNVRANQSSIQRLDSVFFESLET